MLDKDVFLNKYKLEEVFEVSGLQWDILEGICEDYQKRVNEIDKCVVDLKQYILDGININIHSINGRRKDPEHLIEKIIRKRGIEQSAKYKGINEKNYRDIVHDLIGIRILVLSKEDWEGVFDWLVGKFHGGQKEDCFMAEEPVAYTRYGDRDIFHDKIHREHSNKGYRSQHYIVKFEGYYCEIQARTLSEEVYGEFDHFVKYPYRNNNKFLVRYTNTVSQLLNSVDEIISTCFQLGEAGWEICDNYYEDDKYIDWTSISQKVIEQSEDSRTTKNSLEEIDVTNYVNRIILRKA